MDIKAFKGLNNVTDPLRVGLGWLTTANNVNITDTGAVEKRTGYALHTAGSYSSIYSTLDFQRMYVVVGGAIKTFAGVTVAALTSSAPMYWTEVNDYVYYNNGVDSGVIAPDNTAGLWRGAPISEGAGFKGDDGVVQEALYDTLPLGTSVVQFWKGRMYAAQYFASENQTVVWASEPLGFHMFALDNSFFIVPGQVHMLAPHEEALIVGTNSRIYAYGDKLVELAEYGVVPGQHWSRDEDRIIFWSLRGVCSALPFKNMTEKAVSVAPGVRAGGCVIREGGQKRYLSVIQQGGSAFNSYP